MLYMHIDTSIHHTSSHLFVQQEAGEFDTKRKSQQRLWLWNHINWQLMQRFSSHNGMPSHIPHMEERVMAGSLAPGTAADLLLDEFFDSCSIKSD